jgi:hypothetical protein
MKDKKLYGIELIFEPYDQQLIILYGDFGECIKYLIQEYPEDREELINYTGSPAGFVYVNKGNIPKIMYIGKTPNNYPVIGVTIIPEDVSHHEPLTYLVSWAMKRIMLVKKQDWYEWGGKHTSDWNIIKKQNGKNKKKLQ